MMNRRRGNKVFATKQVDFESNRQNVVDISYIIKIYDGLPNEKSINILSYMEECLPGNRSKLQLGARKFVSYIKLSGHSDATKLTYCRDFKEISSVIKVHVEFDEFESESTILIYSDYLISTYRSGTISKQTLHRKRSTFKSIIINIFGFDDGRFEILFPPVGSRTGKIYGARIESNDQGKAYSKPDFLLLVAILIKAARYYSRLYRKNAPVEALVCSSFTHYIKGNTVPFEIRHRLNSLRNRDNYILNISSLLYMWLFLALSGISQAAAIRLKRSDISKIEDTDKDFFRIYITDKRKKLKLHPKPLLVKKHHKAIIEEILDYSKFVDLSDSAYLFSQKDDSGRFTPVIINFIDNFKNNTFPHDKLIGVEGNPIRPSYLRLRHSYAEYFNDVSIRSKVLNNNTRTSAKSYSSGNSRDNNLVLSKGMGVYQASLLNGVSLSSLQSGEHESTFVNIVDYEDSKKLLQLENSVNTPSGGICLDSINSPEALRYTRKVKLLDTYSPFTKVRCTNFLACITCKNHIFVNSVDMIYELMSLKKHLEDSKYKSESGGLFGERVVIDSAIYELSFILVNRFDKKLVDKAEQRLRYEGVSIVWSTEDIY